MAEFDPWFTFAHDYSSHRYDCAIAEGGMANILGCTCGFDKAWSEAEAFVARLSAAETERDQVLLSVQAALAQRDRELAAAEARVEAAEQACVILRATVWSISLGDVASDVVTATCLKALEAVDAL